MSEWGRIAENAVAAAAIGTSPDAVQIGFWRKADECDVVILRERGGSNLIEVKRSGKKATRGIDRAAAALHIQNPYGIGLVLSRDASGPRFQSPEQGLWIVKTFVATWLYSHDEHAGGTLRTHVT